MTSTPTACPHGWTPQAITDCPYCKPRQPDASAAAAEYCEGAFNYPRKIDVYEAFQSGAEWGHAQATAQMGERIAELHRRIDRYIKENCTLYEQLAASEKRADAYETALELIERAYATHGERMAHQDCAAKVLSQHKRPTKESAE